VLMQRRSRRSRRSSARYTAQASTGSGSRCAVPADVAWYQGVLVSSARHMAQASCGSRF
jgi:hypothetical protein